jgi:DNA polymerase-3 subunit gamma/tau
MASQSLYRKWRSQTFGELVGQEPVIRTLKNALNSGNLAHAYLFTGPRGTGKTSTARLLAKTINCPQSQNGEPCNVCEQCREITAGNSFNVVEIDAASNRGIDSIRELREKVMMPPTTGKYKVYILDEAHMLTVEAFNALLKTLEEPPPHAIFVMATTDVHKMLPTVLSRCQRFDFKRITTRQIVDHLRFIATQEHVTLESGAAELIARAASGGMRDALSLLDQATAYAGSTIALTQVQAMLGVADPRAIQKFISAVADLDSPAGLHLIHELAEAGADLRQINSQVAEYWRAMMLAKAGANIGEILDHTNDEIREIISMSQSFALEELTEYAKIFAQNELVQRNQGTPQLGLELALLSCIELHRRGKGDQTVAASVNSSGRMPASSSASPSVSRNTYANQSHPLTPVTPAASTSLNTPIRQEQAHIPATPAVFPPAQAPASSISQTSIHNAPSVSVPEQQPQQQQPISTSARKGRDEASPSSTHLQQQVAAKPPEAEKDAGDLPDWDTIAYYDEENVPDQGPVGPLDVPVQTVASTNSVDPVVSFSQDLFLSQHPAKDEHMQNEGGISHTATEMKQEEVVEPPALPIQEVKEKWEYVKRRVKSKKDGAKIAALLNGYTIVGIEPQAGVPVVIIAASALFHYTTLQQQAHYDTIEWALKAELKRDCKVRMLPPSQGGSALGVSIPPPPTSPPTINSTASRTALASQELQLHHSAQKEQLTPAPDNVVVGRDKPQSLQAPTPLRPRSEKTQAGPLPKGVPLVRSDQSESVSSAANAYNGSSQPTPLARMTDVRENTNRGDSRLLFAQKKAKNDQVVQEVVRLFKAEVKDIQLK